MTASPYASFLVQPGSVRLRAPVSESLSRLKRDQLRKFAQYLIARLPEQILPVAQKILDDLLSQAQTDINTVMGAPDPTLGGVAGEQVKSEDLPNSVPSR